MRIELLGPSFTAQHSDARVLDQLVYKWRHTRQVVAQVLVEKYAELGQDGLAESEPGGGGTGREGFVWGGV